MKLGFKSLHPVTQLLFFVAVFVFSLSATHPISLVTAFLCAFIYDIKLRRKKAISFLIKLILPLTVFSAVFNGLFNHDGVTVLFTLPGNINFTLEAVIYGLVFALRAGTAVMWLGSFNEILTNDKIIFLFGRFSPKTALIVSMALRFIPLIVRQGEETEKAHRGIGKGKTSGSFIEKIKNAAKRLSVLISWTLERGIDTQNSMMARGYGLKKRSSYNSYFFSYKDFLFILAVVLGTIMFILSREGLTAHYIPSIVVPFPSHFGTVFTVIFTLLMLSPLIFDITEEKKWSISV